MRLSLISMLLFVTSMDLGHVADARKGKSRGNKKCLNDKCRNRQPEPTAIFDTTISIICPTCDKISCPVKNVRRLRCKGGITYGYCNCCPECAKLEGEPCGGRHTFLGKCDRGLFCQKEPLSPHQTTRTPGQEFTSRSTSKKEWRGKCQRDMSMDQQQECKQECTPEFCTANPKAICSARNVGLGNQDCQGKCQHTSCSACFFQEEPPCQKCEKNDMSCIKKFGKCAKKKTICTRSKYPCKKIKQKLKNFKSLGRCFNRKCQQESSYAGFLNAYEAGPPTTARDSRTRL